MFDPMSMRVFRVDIMDHQSLPNIVSRIEDEIPLQKCSSRIPEIESPSDQFCSAKETMLPLLVKRETLERVGVKPKIDRVSLNITNTCNLRCEYCYADHGAYYSERSLISPTQSAIIVSKVLEYWFEVRSFHFFGGEPFLNLDAIDAIGKAFESITGSGYLPSFVATTNGTLSNNKVIETIKRWGIEIMVSWDGPSEVQDTSRKQAKQSGPSSELVEASIERFDKHGLRYGIECTYNRHHIKTGISIVDLMDFFYNSTGLLDVHIAPVALPVGRQGQGNEQKIFRDREAFSLTTCDSLDNKNLVRLYREATRYSIRNLFSGKGPTLSIVNSIISRLAMGNRSNEYCRAFNSQISIGIDGSVFPCFMFAGDPAFRYGNILTGTFPSKESIEVFRRYFAEFGHVPTGTSEWYEPLFNGCIAADYIATNTLAERYWLPVYQAIIEECIMEVANCLQI
ncbi:MAG: radical SAM protein [Candidatus Scalindua sp.]|nr:radical SAM protein [Candidatus Scalindua sp.]